MKLFPSKRCWQTHNGWLTTGCRWSELSSVWLGFLHNEWIHALVYKQKYTRREKKLQIYPHEDSPMPTLDLQVKLPGLSPHKCGVTKSANTYCICYSVQLIIIHLIVQPCSDLRPVHVLPPVRSPFVARCLQSFYLTQRQFVHILVWFAWQLWLTCPLSQSGGRKKERLVDNLIIKMQTGGRH